jgi:hypothetical protein
MVMHKIFERIKMLTEQGQMDRVNALIYKHLDIKSERDTKEFLCHFEIWMIRYTQPQNISRMRNWEKAYNRGTEVQKLQ